MKRVFAIVGPTGSGKTAASLELSERLPIEVISVDSLQVYRHLDIGSAKPTKKELARLNHHMVDVLDPDQPLTAAWYSQKAREAIDRVFAEKKIPLLVGGAGFYFKAISHPPLETKDIHVEQPNLEEAKKLILEKDPAFLEKIHAHDTYRILRAGQLILQGHIPSERWLATQEQAPTLDLRMICPNHERAALHARINQRVVDMVEGGLVEETQRVVKAFPGCESKLTKAIGYRESLLFLSAKVTKEEMIQGIQTASRQYAKRQLTWFRGQKNVDWVDFDRLVDHVSKRIEQKE